MPTKIQLLHTDLLVHTGKSLTANYVGLKLIDRNAGTVRKYILLRNLPNGDSQDTILSLALDLIDISIFWKLEFALECTKASLHLLLPPVNIHFLFLALATDSELAVLVYVYLQTGNI